MIGLLAPKNDQRINVENESDAAITQYGGGGYARDLAVIGFKAFDDDLALTLNGVDP